MLRRLYDWVLHWATTPYALVALVAVAFAESSFFPVPPDVLLIAMAMAEPRRAFVYAAWCTAASVAGGVVGYGIGLGLMDLLGCRLVAFYNGIEIFDWLAVEFEKYNFWAVFTAAVTPIPYKVFTITAGAVGAHFPTFLLASVLGRPIRFVAVAGLIYRFGPSVRRFVERYFDWLSVAFVVLLVGGFTVLGIHAGDRNPHREPGAAGSPYARLCGSP